MNATQNGAVLHTYPRNVQKGWKMNEVTMQRSEMSHHRTLPDYFEAAARSRTCHTNFRNRPVLGLT